MFVVLTAVDIKYSAISNYFAYCYAWGEKIRLGNIYSAMIYIFIELKKCLRIFFKHAKYHKAELKRKAA